MHSCPNLVDTRMAVRGGGLLRLFRQCNTSVTRAQSAYPVSLRACGGFRALASATCADPAEVPAQSRAFCSSSTRGGTSSPSWDSSRHVMTRAAAASVVAQEAAAAGLMELPTVQPERIELPTSSEDPHLARVRHSVRYAFDHTLL